MADAAGRFQNLSALKPKPLRRLIHGTNDDERSVMGVDRGGAGGFDFVLGQQFGQQGARFARTFGEFGKGGGKPAPADIFYQNRPFFRRGRALLAFYFFERADDIEVLIEFLPGRAFTKMVGIRDAIAIEIPRRALRLVSIRRVAVR